MNGSLIYPPAVMRLVEPGRLNPLGPGTPNHAVRERLAGLSAKDLLAPHPVCDQNMAQACLAGLWLHHDFLDECHAVSQEISTPTGSYWHGLMHRREPDLANSAYWFRRVGQHAVFATLCDQVRTRAAEWSLPSAARFLADQTRWDPFAFINLCQEVLAGHGEAEEICLQVQQLEWQLLFDYCLSRALGRE